MTANKSRRFLSCALLAALLLPQAAYAAAPIVETDEAVYVNLDYYGLPEQTRIVKGANLNGHTEFTDYGDYTAVHNMSTYDQPELGEGTVNWKLADAGLQRFYYECVPQPDQPIEMPWTFDVSYRLNGVPVAAEKCAGASGLIEMTIHAMPNQAASDYYKNNMTLICATGIDMSDALSIEAPGAQIQSMGTYKLVVFMGLPGEENTFTVRIGSNSFESMGLILFMAPATLSSLDILADMRDIKDRLGTSGDELYQGLNDMLSTMQSMQSGLGVLSSGISGINEVRKQLIADRVKLDPQTDAALDALEELAGRSDSLIPELESSKTTLNALNATVNSMLGTLEESSADVTEYQALLRQIKTSLDNLNDLFDELDGKTSADWLYLGELRTALNNLKANVSKLQTELDTLSTYISALPQSIGGNVTATVTQLVGAGLMTPEDANTLGALLNALVAGTSDVSGSLQSLSKRLSDLSGDMARLLSVSDSMLANLEDICNMLDGYDGLPQDFTAEGQKLTALLDTTLERMNQLLADIPALSTALQQLTADAVSAADKGQEILLTLSKVLDTSYTMLSTLQQSLRAVRSKADDSMQASLDGLIDVLDKAVKSSGTGSLQSANSSIHSALNDAEKDLEADTNVLNLDSSAALQSVTSSSNPAPTSLQFILRTREITIDDTAEPDIDNGEATNESVLTRIFNIFKKLFSAVYGVFTSDT